ncbi:hypothetical protein LCGC14_1202920 [marine sediment metagenome]|uniref:Transcription regulator PadR N-terminal domain-containing protein n=1 Tax=marine sediment metagenome TaxID=412755 RepID=A0A0F9PL34_9ZZZZ|nr:hypothetical protein [archaeon]
MKLTKDLFNNIEGYLKLIVYLYSHPNFTLNEIKENKEFNISYSAFFKQLQHWVKQEFIVEERMPPQLGAIKYKYRFSEKANNLVKNLSKILTGGLNFFEELIKIFNELGITLTKAQIKKLKSKI